MRNKEVKQIRLLSADAEVINAAKDVESKQDLNINSVLSLEVLLMILEMVSTFSQRVMSIMGAFVCQLWRQFLHPHKP